MVSPDLLWLSADQMGDWCDKRIQQITSANNKWLQGLSGNNKWPQLMGLLLCAMCHLGFAIGDPPWFIWHPPLSCKLTVRRHFLNYLSKTVPWLMEKVNNQSMDGSFPLLIVKWQSWKWPSYWEIKENEARNDSLGQSDKNCYRREKEPKNGHMGQQCWLFIAAKATV